MFEEKKNTLFYVATFTGPIPKLFDRNPAPAILGILANYAFRRYISYICIQCGYPFLNLHVVEH